MSNRSTIEYFSDDSRWTEETGWIEFSWRERAYNAVRVIIDIPDPRGIKKSIYTSFRKIRIVEGQTQKEIFRGVVTSCEPKVDDSKGRYLKITAFDGLTVFSGKTLEEDYSAYARKRSVLFNQIVADSAPPGMFYTSIYPSHSSETIKRNYVGTDKKPLQAMEDLAREEVLSGPTPGDAGYGFIFYIDYPKTIKYIPVGGTNPVVFEAEFGLTSRTNTTVPMRGEYSFQDQAEESFTRVVAIGTNAAGEEVRVTKMGTDSNSNGWSDDEEEWGYIKEKVVYVREEASTSVLNTVANSHYQKTKETVSKAEIQFTGFPYVIYGEQYYLVRVGHLIYVTCEPESFTSQPFFLVEIEYSEPSFLTKVKATYPGAISYYHPDDIQAKLDDIGGQAALKPVPKLQTPPKGYQHIAANIQFTATGQYSVSWTSGNITFQDGTIKSVYSGAATLYTTMWYIYYEYDNSILQTTSDIATANTSTHVLVAFVFSGATSSDKALIIPMGTFSRINLDQIIDGSSYGRVKDYALSADGLILLDSVVEGSYGRVKKSSLTAEGLVTMDQIVDGSYAKVASTCVTPSGLITMDTVVDGAVYARTKASALTPDGLVVTDYLQDGPNKFTVDGDEKDGANTAYKWFHASYTATGVSIRTSESTSRVELTAGGLFGYNLNQLQVSIRATDGAIVTGTNQNVRLDYNGLTVDGRYAIFKYGPFTYGYVYGTNVQNALVVQASQGHLYLVTESGIGDIRIQPGSLKVLPNAARSVDIGSASYPFHRIYGTPILPYYSSYPSAVEGALHYYGWNTADLVIYQGGAFRVNTS